MASVDAATAQSPYLTAHTCDHCQRINLCVYKEKIQLPCSSSMDSWDTPSQRQWDFMTTTATFTNISLHDLDRGSRAGCDFAKYLFPRIAKDLPEHLVPQLKICTIYSAFYGILPLKHIVSNTEMLEFSILSRDGTEEGSAIASDPRFNSSFVYAPTHKGLERYHGIKYILTTDESKRVGSGVRYRRPIVCDPLTPDTIKSIRDWRSKCGRERTLSHMVCSLSDPRFFPSRLIRVRPRGPECELKLVCGKTLKEESPEYTALSYCWGVDLGYTLRLSNLESYMEEIPWGKVPKTIQDAALTTQRLGIQYIWVDSFCIIQDDPYDKTREISQMTEVYTYATLTIAARRAKDAQAGFLQKRSLPSGTSTITLRYDNGEEGKVTLTFQSALKDEEETRLDTRGWALQEYLLSRRLLAIETWVTGWSCRNERYSSDNSDGWCRILNRDSDPFEQVERWPDRSGGTALAESHALDALAFFSVHLESPLPRPDIYTIQKSWVNLVERYTTRSLSQPTDRIKAISGLAKNFSSMYESRYGLKYAAGMWCQEFPGALLWSNRALHKSPRPTKWQGPSWSWTAINGNVTCGIYNLEPCAEVESVSCELVSPQAPFGELREGSGTLRIRGWAMDLEWKYTRPNNPQYSERGTPGSEFRYLESVDRYVDAGVAHWLDAQEPDTDWTRVTLLAISPGSIYDSEGIILKEYRDRKYSRLGYFQLLTNNVPSPLPAPVNWPKREYDIV